jgi:hypothetical protein
VSVRDQLARQIGPVLWSDIRPHLARDGVILVSAQLDLLDVAEAVARNDTDRVSAWIARGEVDKPTPAEIERWSSDESLRFVAVVAAPFVLVHRPAASPSPN